MFSPFRDANGAPKRLAEVTWDDLAQLADLDEGFVLEFKREYGPSVQRKIPRSWRRSPTRAAAGS